MPGQVLLCVESERKAVEYREALLLAGLAAERLTTLVPGVAVDGLRELGAAAGGVVLAGGPDLHPRHYGEEPIPEAGMDIDEPLDELDLEVLTGAASARTPVWAICRGMQTVNVYLGGTLYQDLALQHSRAGTHDFPDPLDHPAHPLERISADTEFGSALARQATEVNSRHHQAVKELSPELREVAWSPDHVLESLEHAGDWWLRGVQWHPENLTALPVQLELWRDFVEEASS